MGWWRCRGIAVREALASWVGDTRSVVVVVVVVVDIIADCAAHA